LTDQIRTLEERLHDPGLYARDRAAFDRLTGDLDKARATLAAAEDEWLALEEKREALAG
jgi:ATP-binding cassette subfamily F protein uup